MSESMVERVARAIHEEAHRHSPNCWSWDNGARGGTRQARHRYFRYARAVIAAMREPTDDQRNNYYELSGKTEVFIDAAWERAIDAALK